MNTYKIIHDEAALKHFILWLPYLGENEVFYLSLFARKKYAKELIDSNDKTQLKRFTATKENMLYKIRQLEIPVGNYMLKTQSVPQDSLVLYIHINPRDMKKATELMGKRCWDLMKNQNYNLHQEAMSCIQVSKGNSKRVTFDIDTKDVDFEPLKNILDSDCYDIIETRGGYHLVINTVLASSDWVSQPEGWSKKWYKQILDLYGKLIDQHSDIMSPVVGTIQGGFVPKFVKF